MLGRRSVGNCDAHFSGDGCDWDSDGDCGAVIEFGFWERTPGLRSPGSSPSEGTDFKWQDCTQPFVAGTGSRR